MCEKVHAHGALAAIELAHNGPTSSNLYSREVAIAPSHQPLKYGYPQQARAMTLRDIRDYRRWHRDAALRAKRAGFDIVYIYAAHDLSLRDALPAAATQPAQRRVRRLARKPRAAAARADRRHQGSGRRHAARSPCASRPRNSSAPTACARARRARSCTCWPTCRTCGTSTSPPGTRIRSPRASPRRATRSRSSTGSRSITTKPVVGVGRFTSPDTMVGQIRRGVLDFIGAARPSIADPFLPRKIEEGRIDDIRECIGCNICVTGDMTSTPIRCTQNPTMGEEWRKGWHPERIAPRQDRRARAGRRRRPAGLEAARALGQRGYEVHLAEASRELGGRVSREARLPGLGEWARVRDWRVGQMRAWPMSASIARTHDRRRRCARFRRRAVSCWPPAATGGATVSDAATARRSAASTPPASSRPTI